MLLCMSAASGTVYRIGRSDNSRRIQCNSPTQCRLRRRLRRPIESPGLLKNSKALLLGLAAECPQLDQSKGAESGAAIWAANRSVWYSGFHADCDKGVPMIAREDDNQNGS